MTDTINEYGWGQVVICTGTFTDEATGAPAVPDGVTFTARDPDGRTVTLTWGVDAAVTQDPTNSNVFHTELRVKSSGRWSWRYDADGAVDAGGRRLFDVDAQL